MTGKMYMNETVFSCFIFSVMKPLLKLEGVTSRCLPVVFSIRDCFGAYLPSVNWRSLATKSLFFVRGLRVKKNSYIPL